jgi:hypothetical protein
MTYRGCPPLLPPPAPAPPKPGAPPAAAAHAADTCCMEKRSMPESCRCLSVSFHNTATSRVTAPGSHSAIAVDSGGVGSHINNNPPLDRAEIHTFHNCCAPFNMSTHLCSRPQPVLPHCLGDCLPCRIHLAGCNKDEPPLGKLKGRVRYACDCLHSDAGWRRYDSLTYQTVHISCHDIMCHNPITCRQCTSDVP